MASELPVIDVYGTTWVNLRAYLMSLLDKEYGKLKDVSRDLADTQVIRGRISAIEQVLELETKILKNNQQAFNTPASN